MYRRSVTPTFVLAPPTNRASACPATGSDIAFSEKPCGASFSLSSATSDIRRHGASSSFRASPGYSDAGRRCASENRRRPTRRPARGEAAAWGARNAPSYARCKAVERGSQARLPLSPFSRPLSSMDRAAAFRTVTSRFESGRGRFRRASVWRTGPGLGPGMLSRHSGFESRALRSATLFGYAKL
jgi:hypothetical protein